MDPLEKYIQENREDLDLDFPGMSKVWEGISSELEVETSKKAKSEKGVTVIKIPTRWLQMAALLVVVFGIALATGNLNFDKGTSTLTANVEKQVLPNEWLEVDHYYRAKVNEQIELLKVQNTNNGNGASEADINDFVGDMDAHYNSLQNDLKGGMNEEEILEALVLHYRKCLQELEKLHFQLNKQQPKNNSNNEKYIIL